MMVFSERSMLWHIVNTFLAAKVPQSSNPSHLFWNLKDLGLWLFKLCCDSVASGKQLSITDRLFWKNDFKVEYCVVHIKFKCT